MFLNQTRVKNIDNILSQFGEGEEVLVILNNAKKYKDILKFIGFDTINVGDSVLPKVKGSVSRYNANGKFRLLRDLPKERIYIAQIREVEDWHGNSHTIYPLIPYNRFQRELIDAPSQELYIMKDKDEKEIVCSSLIKNTEENKLLIKHIINLFLEIFQECQVVDKDLISRIKTPIKKLNWNFLPKGKISWEQLEKHLDKNKDIQSSKNSREIYARINYINSFEPDFIATGNGGFNDYIVLGFEDKNIYILENRKPQNATYIFEKDWKELTQLTKGDILREKLQKTRLIHTENWKENLKNELYGI
ncbi:MULTISPECIES: hypothetical protein [Aliarcobacter]|uniref:hypothetical protein n=1 Tax=Aliarcobacter TaxID=2321111 RepID=UPI00189F635C|nr:MULTISPECIES: hypothetical protein [Aliarcobacter]MBF7071335.1 hypothetical protein [Aliarcobacter butzleri]MBL3518926.1 hypothetical protein [Aliarcobacter lanthieri]MDN5093821.1 hypothetical protein [Aliarcobacter butzleri]